MHPLIVEVERIVSRGPEYPDDPAFALLAKMLDAIKSGQDSWVCLDEVVVVRKHQVHTECEDDPCTCDPANHFVKCDICGYGSCTSDGFGFLCLWIPPDGQETDVCEGCLDVAKARGYLGHDPREEREFKN